MSALPREWDVDTAQGSSIDPAGNAVTGTVAEQSRQSCPAVIYRPAGLALPPICLGFHLPWINQPEAFDPTTAYKQGGLQTSRAGARGFYFLQATVVWGTFVCVFQTQGQDCVCATRRD